jgi:hypothetical protein
MGNYEVGRKSAVTMVAAALIGAGAIKLAEASDASAETSDRITHIDRALAVEQVSNDASETGPIDLHNFQPLYDLLLPAQFNAVYFDLSQFVQKQVDPSITEATIGHLSNAGDGTLSFMVSAKGSHRKSTFEEIVDRHRWNKITVSVPKYHYHKTLKTY